MSTNLARSALIAAAAAVFATALTPAYSFTLSGAAPETSATSQVQKVWYDRWGNWHPGRYGYGPLGVVGAVGAVAAGAVVGTAEVVGGAVAPGPCYRHYYTHGYGWRWRRVC